MGNSLYKFRAWDKREEEWISVGFHIIGEVTVFDILNQYPIERIADFEITQYTGNEDKHGMEIYEKDIVKVINPDRNFIGDLTVEKKGVVTGDYDCFGTGYEITLIEWAIAQFFEFEIIGNIYEGENNETTKVS